MAAKPINIPTNPADLKKIKEVVEDISNALTMIEDRRSYINDAKKALRDDYDFDNTAVSALIKMYHTDNVDVIHDQLDLYESVFKK